METQTRSERIAEKNGGHNAAVRAERERCAELTKIGELYGADDLARDAIDSGASVEQLNRQILERSGNPPMRHERPEIGMSRSEVENFSVIRLINARVDPDNYARSAGAELEASRAAGEKSNRGGPNTLHIPADVMLAQRDLTVGTAADGGNLVATNLLAGNFIDLLRNASVVEQVGATFLPGLDGNVLIPRQSGAETTYWLAENGTPSESNATFDQVPLTPKTVGAYSELSRRLLKQSTPYAENLVLMSLAQSLAQAIDIAAVNGSGASNQPLGILGTSGIGDVAMGANGAAIDWDAIVELESSVAAANADIGSLGYLTNSSVRGALKKARIESGQTDMCWDRRTPQTPLNGYRALVSNAVPANLVKGSSGAVCSALIFGNFADLLVGMWGSLDLQVNPYSLDTSGAVRITSFQDVDIAVRNANSFAAIQDALTS